MRLTRMAMPGWAWAAALAMLLPMLLPLGCAVGTSLDRDAALVEDIRVDSVRILPLGSRFVLADSATRLSFRKFHAGYVCSEILEVGLNAGSAGNPTVFRPKTSIRLPGSEECALETAGRDTTIAHVFGPDLDAILVTGSAGIPTDSAKVARGSFSLGSLEGKFSPLTRAFSQGSFTVIDTSGGAPSRLYADSLSACQFLNQAESAVKADSVIGVRYSLMTVDSLTQADACLGGPHRDSIPIFKAAP